MMSSNNDRSAENLLKTIRISVTLNQIGFYPIDITYKNNLNFLLDRNNIGCPYFFLLLKR